jgi:hypothetical protein
VEDSADGSGGALNKYKRHSRANLAGNLRKNMMSIPTRRDPLGVFDEDHKESQEALNARISSAFSVARQMFEILHASDLSEEGRVSAMQFLNVLVHRF